MHAFEDSARRISAKWPFLTQTIRRTSIRRQSWALYSICYLGGFWEFPGGKIESGETAQAALARELIEELDAGGVTVGALVGVAAHDYGSFEVQIEAYWVTCDHTSLRNLEHEKIDWFAPTDFDLIALAPADQFLLPLLATA